jgi:hypothetical protein
MSCWWRPVGSRAPTLLRWPAHGPGRLWQEQRRAVHLPCTCCCPRVSLAQVFSRVLLALDMSCCGSRIQRCYRRCYCGSRAVAAPLRSRQALSRDGKQEGGIACPEFHVISNQDVAPMVTVHCNNQEVSSERHHLPQSVLGRYQDGSGEVWVQVVIDIESRTGSTRNFEHEHECSNRGASL